MSPFNYFFDTFISRACTDSDFNLVRARTRHNKAIAHRLRWRDRMDVSHCRNAFHHPPIGWTYRINSANRAYDCIQIPQSACMDPERNAFRSHVGISFPISSAYGTIWPTPKSHFSAFTCAQWHTRVAFVIRNFCRATFGGTGRCEQQRSICAEMANETEIINF